MKRIIIKINKQIKGEKQTHTHWQQEKTVYLLPKLTQCYQLEDIELNKNMVCDQSHERAKFIHAHLIILIPP